MLSVLVCVVTLSTVPQWEYHKLRNALTLMIKMIFVILNFVIPLYLSGPLHFNVSTVPWRIWVLGTQELGLDNLDLANKHTYTFV